VKSILVENPLINGIVLEDGRVNWDISDEKPLTETAETTEEDSESTMSVSLKRFAISGGRIYYVDQTSDIDASLEGFSLELRGDFSVEQTELKLSSDVDRINAKMGGIRYLKDAVFELDLLAAANMVENRYTLKENLITLNGLTLGTEGEVLLMDGGAMDLDLRFFSRETSFKTLLSLVPAVYLQDFESLETSGSLQLDGTVSGIMKDTILPDLTLSLQVKDGYFSYPDLPRDVSDVQIALNLDYKGADMDASRVDLVQLHLLLGGNPFDMVMQVDHPISDMHVAGRVEGIIDFATLKDVVPLEDVDLRGRLETKLRWDALMSNIEKEQYDQVDLDGSLLIEGVLVESPDIPVPVILEEVNMAFNPSIVELNTFDLMLGSSDLHMNGELENFIPYVFDGQTVSGHLNLSSTLLNANELLPEEEAGSMEDGVVASDSIVPVSPDSLAQPLGIKIPENIDFAMAVDMQRVEFNDLVIENMKGAMQVVGGVAGMEHLQMDMAEGHIVSTGWVDTRGEYAEVDFDLNMHGVDIPTAYKSIISVEKMMPMAKYCKGKANIEMKFHSLMDNTLKPLYESIDAKGDAHTKGLQFFKLDEFVPISDLLKNKKFTEMAPDEVDVGFTVREGRIIFNPFDWEIDESTFVVSGSHGIDLSMDYNMDMNIAKSDLGADVNEMMQGITALAAVAGITMPQSDYIKVKANIGGNFNHPKFTTDFSENLLSSGEQVQAIVEERITEEVEKVETQVREGASEQSEKIIAEAETEAERLVEEARKAGEALVKEAEAQGEKLMEEAGSNPLKQVAARTAANELKRQAETQSVNLVNEAEEQGEALIQKAREEADKI
jgi:vacuolar-type H+-ATPase subunit H